MSLDSADDPDARTYEYKDRTLLWRMIQYLLVYRKLFASVVVLTVFSIIISVWTPFVLMKAIDVDFPSGNLQAILYTALFYIVLATAGVLPPGGMIGASGCVLAVLGACALLFPQFQVILFIFPVPIRFAAALFCGIYVLNLLSRGVNAGGDAAHLAGLVYGVLWPLYGERWLRSLQAVRQYDKQQRHMHSEQDVRAELDRILRKVHEQGVNSLTAAEKRTLADATRRQQGR